jgi:hypothetical protein
MWCSLVVFLAGAVFAIGYLVGYSAFKKSPKRTALSIVSGITALVVVLGIVFAGCLVLLSGTSFH